MLEIIIPILLALLALAGIWWQRERVLLLARKVPFLRKHIDRAAAKALVQQKENLPPEAQKILEKSLRGDEEAQIRTIQEATELAESGNLREAAERLQRKPRTADQGRQREKAKARRRQRQKAAKKARRKSR